MKVSIVGAGIGGDTLALALSKMNIEYVVLEQASAFQEVGGSIQISPNGVRVLEQQARCSKESQNIEAQARALCVRSEYSGSTLYTVWVESDDLQPLQANFRFRAVSRHHHLGAHRSKRPNIVRS